MTDQLASFLQHLCIELSLDAEQITPDSMFIQDLAFDSLQMIELQFAIEDLGVEISEDELWALQSPRHAFDLYVKRAEATSTQHGGD